MSPTKLGVLLVLAALAFAASFGPITYLAYHVGSGVIFKAVKEFRDGRN